MPATGKLTLRQEKFVSALTTPKSPAFCKPSVAYRESSPTVTPGSSWTGASRMLGNVEVIQAVRGQLGLEKLGSGLKLCLRESRKLIRSDEVSMKLSAMREHRETLMDYAKLTGQLVERREVLTIDVQAASAIRELVDAAMSDNSGSVKLAETPMVNQQTDA